MTGNDEKKLIGVDIGGTKIAVGLVENDGTIVDELVVPSVPSDREMMFETVVKAIRTVIERTGLSESAVAIGVGVPGIVDTEAGIAIFQNNLEWSDFPLKERLETAFSSCAKIQIDNDVVQAGLAEWQAQKLSATDTMVFLTISTGISSPIFCGGRPLRGLGVSGELGILPIRQANGTSERLETVASGPAIQREGQRLYQDASLTTAAVFEKYWRGEAIATGIIEQVLDELAEAIYALVTLVNPNRIVLGGSVILKNPGLLPLLKERLAMKIAPIQERSIESLVLSTYNNRAGLVGAALSAAN